MTQLLDGKCALVMGGGQTPGETIGNGRATAIQFAPLSPNRGRSTKPDTRIPVIAPNVLMP